MSICPKCGQNLPDGSAFCDHCGNPVNAPVQPQEPHTEPGFAAEPIAQQPSQPAAPQAGGFPQPPVQPWQPVQAFQPAAPVKPRKKFDRFYILLIISCAVVVVLIGATVTSLIALLSVRSELDGQNSYVNSLLDEIDELQVQADADELLTEKAQFMDDYIVIVPDDEEIYHKYDCYLLDDMKQFIAFNMAYADADGYTPCSDCIE